MSKQMIIACIEKHSLERVRVQLDTWNGDQYIDARVWYRKEASDGEAWHPTKKGVRIHCELLPELISALQKAQREVERGPG